MNSKTSLFNKTIIKTDLKRFWWIGALYMVAIALFVLPNPVDVYRINIDGVVRYLTDSGMFALCAAFFAGGMLFSYLHNGKAVSSMHGVPVTRTSLYVSHYVSGVILLGLPIIIGSAVMGIELMYYGVGIKFAVKYFYTCTVYAAAMFSLASFASMIAGNTIAAYVFTAGFVALPVFLISMIDLLFCLNLYGYVSGNLENILGKIYIIGVDNMWDKISLWYIIFAVIIGFVGLWLYKIRELEYFDEIVVFKPLKYVFMITVTTCFALFGYYIFDNMFSINNIFCAIPLGLVALIAVHMLNNKSFSLKGILTPLVVFVAGVSVVYAAFATDITGFEKRVPDVENIESIVTFDDRPVNVENSYKDGIYYEEVAPEIAVTNINEIENLVAFHKAIISDGDSRSNGYRNYNARFKYNLKDGSVIERYYDINIQDYEEYYKEYIGTDFYKKYSYPIIDDSEKIITSVVYEGVGSKTDTYIQNIDYNNLLEAIKTDVYNLSGDDLLNYNSYDLNVITVHYDQFIDYNGKRLKYELSENIPVDNYFKNTSAIINNELKNHTNDFVNPDSITNVNISGYWWTDDGIDVTDAKEAREIYDILKNLQVKPKQKNDVNVRVDFVFNYANMDLQKNVESLSIPYENLPEQIKKYVPKPSYDEYGNIVVADTTVEVS